MQKDPQQTSIEPGAQDSSSLEELREKLKRANAEKAILELQLREYSEKLDQKVEERTRELEAINRIAATVSRSLNLDVILRESLTKVLELLELDVGGVYLADEKKGKMQLMMHQGLPSDVAEEMAEVPIGEGCPGLVAMKGEPVVVDNTGDVPDRGDALARHAEFKSVLGIPLESKGQVRGAMCVLSTELSRFSTDDLKLLVAIGSEIGVAIENAWLYEKSYIHSKKMEELSITDSLTGLYNRRHFYRKLREEMARADRQKHDLALLVLDLDNLKEYNDELGHLKGDEALQGVARAVTVCIRQDVDTGYRYGGDEFTVILPYSDQARAYGVGERIRKTYEDFSFPNTSLSVGLTQMVFGESEDEFVTRADSAMYRAKSFGGNRVEVMKTTGEDS